MTKYRTIQSFNIIRGDYLLKCEPHVVYEFTDAEAIQLGRFIEPVATKTKVKAIDMEIVAEQPKFMDEATVMGGIMARTTELLDATVNGLTK